MKWLDIKKAQCGKEIWWKQYIYNVFRTLSQFTLSILGGDPDETVSGATGKASLQGHSKYFEYQELVIDMVFGDGHCKEVIEWDRGVLGINNWYDIKELKKMGFPQVDCKDLRK